MISSVRAAVSVGWKAIKENRLPMIVLWCCSVALVVSYYRMSAISSALEPFAKWQGEYGELAAFANRVVFCGLLPGVFMVSMKSIRPPRVGWVVLAYSIWGGVMGILFDWFSSFQAYVFGAGVDWRTLVKKTIVDQFMWNVLFCTPAGALFYSWASHDFNWKAPESFTAFILGDCLTILVSNWLVWIPVMLAIYAFPTPLQVQLVGLASSFWMLVALKAGGCR